MKTLLTLMSFILLTSSFTPSQTVTLISSYSYIYTESSFDEDKVLLGEDEQPIILYHGDKLVVEQENGDFVLIYKQGEPQIKGYVYKYYLSSNSSQVVYPVFNGKIRTNNAVIYDIDKSPTEYRAKSGQEVYIYGGFDDDEDYTAVQLVLEDGSLYNGYVLTADLEPKGVSSLLIIGITIISACVTIILTILFMKKNKKTKKEK